MKLLILIFFLSTLLFSCNKAKFFQLPNMPTELQRYIVYDLNYDINLRDMAKDTILQAKGQIYKKLRYHRNTYVAYMNPKYIPNPLQVGVIIEKDIIKKASGCSQEPEPEFPDKPDNQPDQIYTWGQTRVHTKEAHTINRGANVIVCIVDTGVDYNHIDLKDNILGGESFVDTESDYMDYNGHGSHTSGTVAALDNSYGVVGVAPDAKIFAVKVLDQYGSGYSSDIADGVISCINNGAHIISMSLGGTQPSNIIHEAIIKANKAGAIIVAAAGNDAGDVNWPAAFEETLAISALDEKDQLANFSSFGPEIDFIMPGVRVKSTVPNDNYAEYSGTSMATPMAAGVLALMISSGNADIVTEWLNLPSYQIGRGLMNALETVKQ